MKKNINNASLFIKYYFIYQKHESNLSKVKLWQKPTTFICSLNENEWQQYFFCQFFDIQIEPKSNNVRNKIDHALNNKVIKFKNLFFAGLGVQIRADGMKILILFLVCCCMIRNRVNGVEWMGLMILIREILNYGSSFCILNFLDIFLYTHK